MRCYGDNYTFIFHAPVAEMAERRFLTLECRVPFSFLRSLLFIFRRVQECITLNVQKYCHAQQTTNLGENTACWTFGRLPSSFFFAIFPFKTAKKHRLILFYDWWFWVLTKRTKLDQCGRLGVAGQSERKNIVLRIGNANRQGVLRSSARILRLSLLIKEMTINGNACESVKSTSARRSTYVSTYLGCNFTWWWSSYPWKCGSLLLPPFQLRGRVFATADWTVGEGRIDY